jgi:hypothetical protein
VAVRLRSRAWAFVTAAWGAVSGAAPHVLHHVGPLAGAAFLGGITGKAVFFGAGLLLSVPLLRKLHRRTRTLLAPALAVAAFAGMFAVSTILVGPRLADEGGSPPAETAPDDHDLHHPDPE